MKKFTQRFMIGLSVIPNGVHLVKKEKGLKKYIFIPIFINVLLFILGLVWLSNEVGGIAESILTSVKEWNETLYSIIYWFLLVGVWVAVTGSLILVIYFCSSVIAAPFYSLLAERALMSVGNLQERPFQWMVWISTSVKMLLISLGKAIILLGVTVLVFITSLIPGLNFVALYVTYLLIAFDCSDYVLEAKEVGLSGRFNYLKKKWPELSGLALSLGVLSLVPGLIFLAIPFSITGIADLIHKSGD